jgi:hypothetical protein
MAEHAEDDPFERAARRERRAAMRAQYGVPPDYEVNAAPGMLGVTAAWAVVLWLHSYLGNSGGWLFRTHFVLFVLFGAITAGVVVHAIAKRLLVARRSR